MSLGGARRLDAAWNWPIYWSPKNVQCVLVLRDTREESTLIYSNPGHFPGPTAFPDGYRDHITILKTHGTLGIGWLSPYLCDVYVSLVAENILGLYILHGSQLDMQGEFQL